MKKNIQMSASDADAINKDTATKHIWRGTGFRAQKKRRSTIKVLRLIKISPNADSYLNNMARNGKVLFDSGSPVLSKRGNPRCLCRTKHGCSGHYRLHANSRDPPG